MDNYDNYAILRQVEKDRFEWQGSSCVARVPFEYRKAAIRFLNIEGILWEETENSAYRNLLYQELLIRRLDWWQFPLSRFVDSFESFWFHVQKIQYRLVLFLASVGFAEVEPGCYADWNCVVRKMLCHHQQQR